MSDPAIAALDADPPKRAGAFTPFRGARAAVTFLTRLPVGGFPYADAEWAWCSAWLPAVGLFLIGPFVALAFALGHIAAGPFVAAVLSIGVSLLVTGCFHEDGLADTADALGGATSRDRIFEILKDSRIGAFGAAALVVVVLLRVALLARLDALAPVAIVLAHGMSRLPPVWMMRFLPYVTPADAARNKPVARAGAAQVVVATVTVLAALAGGTAAQVRGMNARTMVVALASAMLVAVLCAWRFKRRAGGITGDFLGATQQLADLAVLLALTSLEVSA